MINIAVQLLKQSLRFQPKAIYWWSMVQLCPRWEGHFEVKGQQYLNWNKFQTSVFERQRVIHNNYRSRLVLIIPALATLSTTAS